MIKELVLSLVLTLASFPQGSSSYILCSTYDCMTWCYKCNGDQCELISVTQVEKCGYEPPPEA